MNSIENNPKVVDFAQRAAAERSNADKPMVDKNPPEKPDRPSAEVITPLRTHAFKRLAGLVTTLFENTDDALFDLANKADNNGQQANFFDAMRELRKRRQAIETRFQEQLTRQFSDFVAGRGVAMPAKAEAGEGGLSLSLVDEQELEESLAIAAMVAKTENRVQRALHALNQRLAHVLGLRAEDLANPFAPAPIAEMFRQAMTDLQAALEVKLIVHKLFDRYVMSGLDAVYDELNGLLVQAGVLPQLRGGMPMRRMAPGGASRPPGTAAGMDPGAPPGSAAAGYPGTAYDSAAADFQAGLYGTLQALLAGRRTSDDYALGGGYGQGGAALPVFSATELLAALGNLQNQALAAQGMAESVQQVKDQLIRQAGALHGEDKAGVAGTDEDTIDLVGMLFEYILQDRNLPAQIQALLGRLQIPFIKVALLDKHLFARRTHPARQLLDTLAEACVGWSEESDRDRRLYDKVREVVETLLKDFVDDLGIFDRLRVDFEAFVEANKRRAELAEQRAAEATRGREKLLAARRTAAREILQRIEAQAPPELIRNLLSRPWANYLVLVVLRQGEGSEEWTAALQFVDELLWSVRPKADAAEKTRLRGLLPSIEKRLRHGLATVAFDEHDMRRLMQQMNQLYQSLLGEAPAAAASEVSAEAASLSAPIPETGGENVLAALEEDNAPPPESVDPRTELQVRELKVGTWIEFRDAQGNTERAKLSWISPISAKYLFVNRKGLKVADKSAAQLAVELASGRAAVLEEVPLFDRALDAIVERLKANQATRPGTPSPAAG